MSRKKTMKIVPYDVYFYYYDEKMGKTKYLNKITAVSRFNGDYKNHIDDLINENWEKFRTKLKEIHFQTNEKMKEKVSNFEKNNTLILPLWVGNIEMKPEILKWESIDEISWSCVFNFESLFYLYDMEECLVNEIVGKIRLGDLYFPVLKCEYEQNKPEELPTCYIKKGFSENLSRYARDGFVTVEMITFGESSIYHIARNKFMK